MVEHRSSRLKAVLLSWLVWLSLCVSAFASVPCSVPFTLTNGTTADATQVMANYNALIACFTNTAAAGANSDITSLNALTSPIPPTSGGTNVFLATAATGGAVNAQTIATTTPTGFALTSNFSVVAKIGLTNTGPTTLQVGALTATNVFKQSIGGPVSLTGGELQTGDIAWFTFDGTQFELLNPHIQQGAVNGLVNIASAATTDIASTGSHNVNITGTTTITNFGNTLAGQTAFPRYIITLNGSQVNVNTANCATTGGCIFTPGGVNFTSSSATNGEKAVLQYLGQGSNTGAGAGNWLIESLPRSQNGIGRQATTPQTFTANGTYTPTIGMLFVEVECVGGGAAGGGSPTTTGDTAGGGGGGGYTKGFFSAATIGASQTVTIGTGGAGVANGAGGNGGNTTFGALLTANGGTGAVAATSSLPFNGGVGGTASGGYVNIKGNTGFPSYSLSGNSYSGAGAPGYQGLGAGQPCSGATATSIAGNSANGFGAGGSGACGGTTSTQAGGSGTGGICIAKEFIE